MPLAEKLPLHTMLREPVQLLSPEWSRWFEKLDAFSSLETGWDSYEAPAPSAEVISAAEGFLEFLRNAENAPTRLTPSAVGGVAFSFRNGTKEAFVEFRNTGNAHAAFTDAASEPEVMKVRQDSTGYSELMALVASHLQ